VLVPDPEAEELPAAGRRAGVVAAAAALARDLVNTPPNDLPPAEFARRAEEACLAAGLEVEVLDEDALAAAGFGGVLGVGGGSQRPPRLVRIRHAGTGPRVALVGKGITFDSGGISIKPSAGMDQMKADMAGAAAIVAAMTAVAGLDLPVEVTATVPMAENLPSGSAYRPADVLTMYGGKRVEVLNTDAEGRLILADAIVRACEDSPAYLIETSTLTGAQRVALGDRTAGVMGTDALRARVVAAGERVGDDMWPMPLPGYLRPAWTPRWPTSPTSPATAPPGCWWPGCSCASSLPRASSGYTSTWPARRTTTAGRGDTRPRVRPQSRCAPFLRRWRTSPAPADRFAAGIARVPRWVQAEIGRRPPPVRREQLGEPRWLRPTSTSSSWAAAAVDTRARCVRQSSA
jgi:hypothetical protein